MNSVSFVIGVQIVQVSLCIAAAALVSFTCLRKRPAWAAAVWLAVLCKCATPPVWASPLGVFSWLRAEKPRSPTELPSWITSASPKPRPEGVLTEQSIVVDNVASTPTIAWSSLWPWMLAGVWAAGFVWTFSRAFRLRRRWLAAVVEDCDPPESLVRAVAERSRKLGMKPPRIVMVAADAGPAASGWFRPTVYLPTGADPTQMESMLVHELVHLRRRDPWLGALQAFVTSAYWFHPGVRWASDELSRCIEEACDAETVRELGCRPADYAAALVALLERRVAPSSVPMVAGMSPARSVRRRLEAVMKTNPNRRGRAARGPWLAFAAATLIALPGAGLPPGPPKQQVEFVPNSPILRNPVTPPTAVAATPIGPPQKPIEIKNFSHRGYDLKPAVDVLMKRCGLREDAATNAAANLALAAAEHIGPRPVFAIADQRLFAFAAEAQHEWMSRALASTVDEWGVDQIVIETEIWDAPKAVLDSLKFDVRNEKNGDEVAFLAEADYKELSKRMMADKATNKLAAPKITTLDGQDATVQIGTEYSLGGGKPDENGRPRNVLLGLSLKLEPTFSADGRYVSLKVRFEENKIVFLPKPPSEVFGRPTPEPTVANQRVTETRVSVGLGIRVAIKTEPSKLLMFKCTKAPRPAANFNIDWPGEGRLQSNADPRMKEAMELFKRREKDKSIVVRVYPIDYLLRGNESVERQMTNLTRAWGELYCISELVDAGGKRQIAAWPQHHTIVVTTSVELHERFARMLRDLDRRNIQENLGIPQEFRATAPVGN